MKNETTVLGLGISGFQTALFLHQKGYAVFVSEIGQSEAIQERAAQLRAQGIEVETGSHNFERILNSESVVISPGIPPHSKIYQEIRKAELPVLSEIEIASRFCVSKQIVAVTGSSGKTTVSTLIARVLEKKFGRAFLCGNIGNPWVGELDKIQPGDPVVLEVSSFQLVHCTTFRPHVGVLLNLGANHQDWHPDMDDYVRAKLRIFQNQTGSDFAVLRRLDQELFFPVQDFEATTIYFDDAKTANPNEEVVRRVAAIFQCDTADVEDILRNFEGIEHRLEKVAVQNGVTYVNDSKCTTTASLAWALQKMPDDSVVLVAGGHPKSNDFRDIHTLVSQKVKLAVLIGEARPLLREAWQDACPLWETDNFREAVEMARSEAEAGDTVLLSPACASFDMFKNYLERGMLFKTLVRELLAASASL